MDNAPSPDLYDRIVNQINREHKLLLLKRRLMLYAAASVISAGALVPLVKNLYQELVRSDFFEISTLLFTDFRLVMANLADFTLSALESAPLAALVWPGIFFVCLVYSAGNFVGLVKMTNKNGSYSINHK